METDNQLDISLDDEGSSRRGQLSRRMQEKGNSLYFPGIIFRQVATKYLVPPHDGN